MASRSNTSIAAVAEAVADRARNDNCAIAQTTRYDVTYLSIHHATANVMWSRVRILVQTNLLLTSVSKMQICHFNEGYLRFLGLIQVSVSYTSVQRVNFPFRHCLRWLLPAKLSAAVWFAYICNLPMLVWPK